MSEMKWPPERTIKYTFNSLDRDVIEINAELTNEKDYEKRRNNITKTKGGKTEGNDRSA